MFLFWNRGLRLHLADGVKGFKEKLQIVHCGLNWKSPFNSPQSINNFNVLYFPFGTLEIQGSQFSRCLSQHQILTIVLPYSWILLSSTSRNRIPVTANSKLSLSKFLRSIVVEKLVKLHVLKVSLSVHRYHNLSLRLSFDSRISKFPTDSPLGVKPRILTS